jgi:hypothetical protein
MKSISNTATNSILSQTMEVNIPGRSMLAIGNSLGAGSYGLTTPGGISWCQLPAAVNVGDICHPSYYDLRLSYIPQMRCIQSGNIGTDEPVWKSEGQSVKDGTAVWIVERMISAANQNSGSLRIALAIAGQPFDLDYYVTCPGRPASYICDITNRLLAVINPDILFVSDVFANSVVQLNGDLIRILREWNEFRKILESSIAVGRAVVLNAVAPSVFYNNPVLVNAASYIDSLMAEFSAEYPNNVLFNTDYRDTVSSTVFGENYLPDTSTSYIVYNNPFDKITDGIHPQNVAQYRYGKKLGYLLSNLNRNAYQFLDRGISQKWINPKNLGNGGTLNAPLTGFAPDGWQAGRDGVAVADCQFAARENGSRWWSLDCVSANDGKVWANCVYSLAELDLSIGDAVDFYVEFFAENFSATVYSPRLEIAFYNAVEYPNFANFLYTSGQPFGQAMMNDNLAMIGRPIPFRLKIPVGCTNIALTIEIHGNGGWSGKFNLGRVNLIKR